MCLKLCWNQIRKVIHRKFGNYGRYYKLNKPILNLLALTVNVGQVKFSFSKIRNQFFFLRKTSENSRFDPRIDFSIFSSRYIVF